MRETIEKLEDACSLVSSAKHCKNRTNRNKILSELHVLLHLVRGELESEYQNLMYEMKEEGIRNED